MIIESIINVVFGVLINIFDFLSIPPTPQFLLNLESNILINTPKTTLIIDSIIIHHHPQH